METDFEHISFRQETLPEVGYVPIAQATPEELKELRRVGLETDTFKALSVRPQTQETLARNEVKEFFLQKHAEVLAADKKKLGGLFKSKRQTAIHPNMTLEQLVAHAGKPGNRSHRVFIELGWIEKATGAISPKAPHAIQKINQEKVAENIGISKHYHHTIKQADNEIQPVRSQNPKFPKIN